MIADFFTTEAQRPQRRLCFPWPGDDGQGKKPSPDGERLFVSELTATSGSNAKSRLPEGLGSFLRASLGVPPFGRVSRADTNKVYSVLSVSLWLTNTEKIA